MRIRFAFAMRPHFSNSLREIAPNCSTELPTGTSPSSVSYTHLTLPTTPYV